MDLGNTGDPVFRAVCFLAPAGLWRRVAAGAERSDTHSPGQGDRPSESGGKCSLIGLLPGDL